jgi:hypothetical protein
MRIIERAAPGSESARSAPRSRAAAAGDGRVLKPTSPPPSDRRGAVSRHRSRGTRWDETRRHSAHPVSGVVASREMCRGSSSAGPGSGSHRGGQAIEAPSPTRKICTPQSGWSGAQSAKPRIAHTRLTPTVVGPFDDGRLLIEVHAQDRTPRPRSDTSTPLAGGLASRRRRHRRVGTEPDALVQASLDRDPLLTVPHLPIRVGSARVARHRKLVLQAGQLEDAGRRPARGG